MYLKESIFVKYKNKHYDNPNKKNTIKTSVAKTTLQGETPLKLTKKQRESFRIHEKATKLGGELAKTGILKPYKKISILFL